MTDTETPAYVHANPGRVLSTLAVTMLSQHDWPVCVSTERNYVGYSGSNGREIPASTDPGDTVHGSAHFRPVERFHPLARDGAEWPDIARYLDDRIRPETETDYDLDTEYHEGARHVCGPWDEYFILVEAPHGGNMTAGEDAVPTSNRRSLLRDYPDTFCETGYGWGSPGSLLVPLFVPVEGVHKMDETKAWNDYDTPHYDPDRAEDLAGRLSSLAFEYPLYDEMDHSVLESEREEEAVNDSWNSRNIREGVAEALAALLGATGDNYDLWTDVVEALGEWLGAQTELADWYDGNYHTVGTLYLAHQSEEGNVEHESDGNVTFRNSEDAYAAVAAHILANQHAASGDPILPTRTSLGLE